MAKAQAHARAKPASGPPAAAIATGALLDGAAAPFPARRLSIGVDIGGSGIKAALVDVDTGELRGERIRVKTPQPSTPERCIATVGEIVAALAASGGAGPGVPVGVGVPGVTIDGTVHTASNIDAAWLGFPAESAFATALGRRTAIVNDADAAGIAEMRFGAGRGRSGTVLVVTLGTGIGTALFVDGRLVPNTELGHLEIRGRDAEARASAAVRERRRLTWPRWAALVSEYLRRIDLLLWLDLVIVGGGVSKEADRFLPLLKARPPVVAAELRNEAGIVGAAMIAAGRAGAGPGEGVGPSAGVPSGVVPEVLQPRRGP